ncbi:hypothetical protein [Bacillus massilinigeriensis]|uniref:hypothetical protein n=1 Tax=Bacillus mediterraneensis TaxID=1805474 RepID=UPI0008F91465|nr:hypothetical protein [Bacillus mediterraneensis]
MKNITFAFSQSLFFAIIILINYVSDPYLGSPFTVVDLVVILLSMLTYITLFKINMKIYARFSSVSLKNKIGLSILGFILAVLVLGYLDGYVITG